MKRLLAILALCLPVMAQQHVTVTGNCNVNGTTSPCTVSGFQVVDPVSVSLSAASMTIPSGTTDQITATVQNAQDTSVTWGVDQGSIDASGLLTAPVVLSSTIVTVRATSNADPTKLASVAILVTPVITVTLSPTTASVQIGQTQQFTSQVSGGNNTLVTWTSSGNIGAVDSNGLFTPSTAGQGSVTATSVQDPTVSASVQVTVTNPPPPPVTQNNLYNDSQGNWTGITSQDSAKAPSGMFSTRLSDTPLPGKVITVAAGSDLQAAINSASCGDTLDLAPGATFDYSVSPKLLKFDNKACDAGHYLRLMSGGAQMPPEESRVSPCYFGVASLQGRPPYACPASGAAKLGATILVDRLQGITFNNARFIRIGPGIELTRPAGTGHTFVLANMANSDHVIFDRIWFHGTAADETRHGIMLNDSSNIAVINSYGNDFKCLTGGSCTDAQAVSGGNDSKTGMGRYKIVNNFLEAAAENIIFGGGGSSSTPCDIEVRGNHFFKPWTWAPPVTGTPPTGSPIVKNLFELKNACQVYLEGNLFENNWGGFSQSGYMVLLSPKNPGGTAPNAQVHDVIIRRNWLKHGGGGFQITTTQSTATSTQPATSSLGLWNVSLVDIVIEDVESGSQIYGAAGTFFQITRTDPSDTAVFKSLDIHHVTAVRGSKNLFNIGSHAFSQGVNIFDNILDTGKPGPCSTTLTCQATGTGAGTTDCSYGWSANNPNKIMTACWQPFSVTNNAVLAGWGTWPAGNLMTTSSTAGFVDYANGDYHLSPTSPYKGKASDGKDLGADIDTVLKAISNVQ